MNRPNKKNSNLYKAFRDADWPRFNAIRFDLFSEGEYLFIRDEALAGAKIQHCPARFLGFDNCDLKAADLSHSSLFPASFKNCDMRGADLRHVSGHALFWNCDMRGVKFDDTTRFVVPNATSPSEFENCLMDSEFEHYLSQQGVRFGLSPQSKFDFFR